MTHQADRLTYKAPSWLSLRAVTLHHHSFFVEYFNIVLIVVPGNDHGHNNQKVVMIKGLSH